MDLRIDDKGKYYTKRVTKDMMPAFVRTAEQVVVGNIYVRPDQRLKDELDEDMTRFLPVTDAHVYDAASETLLYQSAIMLVSYSHIIMISPLEAHESFRDVPWRQES